MAETYLCTNKHQGLLTREVLKGHRGAAVLPVAILYPGRVRSPCKVYYPPSFQNGDSTLQPYISIHDDKSPSVMRKDGHLNPPLQFFQWMVLGHPHTNCTNLPAFQPNHTDLSLFELVNHHQCTMMVMASFL